MSFFKKISNIFTSASPRDHSGYWITVRCNRCGEVIRGRIDLYNEPSVDYRDGKPFYFCRKVLIGEQRCFQQVEVTLTFDENHNLIDRQVTGGTFVEE
jgi:uncharacterized Zn finger protein